MKNWHLGIFEMVPQDTVIPEALLTYMEGLKTHDIDLIGSTFADYIRFVTPVWTAGREQVLDFLGALYRAFPDWTYDHEPPEKLGDELYAVKWKQGGTHTRRLHFPGFDPVEPTQVYVRLPKHYFYYKVRNNLLTEIKPDPVPGGAPQGIFDQIGVGQPFQ